MLKAYDEVVKCVASWNVIANLSVYSYEPDFSNLTLRWALQQLQVSLSIRDIL